VASLTDTLLHHLSEDSSNATITTPQKQASFVLPLFCLLYTSNCLCTS